MEKSMKSRDVLENALLINTLLMSRQAYINAQILNPEGRDYDKECGYPIGELSGDYYWKLYESVSIAQRVVNAFPSESWSIHPELYEREDDTITPFEKKWNEIAKRLALWSYMDRVDELSGIGRFGALLLGFDDGLSMNLPVAGIQDDGRPDPLTKGTPRENELLFVRAFDETTIRVNSWEQDIRNPRYGQPLEYMVNLVNPSTPATETGSNQNDIRNQQRVHWTRILHVADNRKTSEVYGMPRMRPVLPEIMDIRKIRGGGAEMYWRGAFPGYSLEFMPGMGLEVDIDKESIQEEMENYANGLQRYIAMRGMTAKSLAPQISDPTAHLVQQYIAIAACIGMPMRVLLGSESGHLAAQQDSATWNRRLTKRQSTYINPWIVNPLVERLLMTGVLPPLEGPDSEYHTGWNDLNTLSAMDLADIALKQTQCLSTYTTSGAEQIMPVLEYFIEVLGLTPGTATAIMKKIRAKKYEEKLRTQAARKPEPEEEANAGGIRKGGDHQNNPGSPGKPEGTNNFAEN